MGIMRAAGKITRRASGRRRERERLAAQIDYLDASARGHEERWATEVVRFVELARAAHDAGRLDAGWTALAAARRSRYKGMRNDERVQEAKRIRAEAAAKLTGWRKQTVLEQIEDPEAASAADLENAQEIIDEHFGNVHRKLGLLTQQIVVVNVLLVLALGTVFAVAWYDLAGDAAPELLRDWRLLLAVMVMGVLGSVVSVASAMFGRDASARVPDLRADRGLVAIRPLTGAASAVLVVVILLSGLGQAVEVTDAGVLAVAAIAGFSERLARRAVDRAVDQITA